MAKATKADNCMTALAAADERAGFTLYWHRENVAREREAEPLLTETEAQRAWGALEPVLRNDYVYEARR